MQRLGGRNKLIKILIKTSDQHEMISPIKFQSKKKLALFCLMQLDQTFWNTVSIQHLSLILNPPFYKFWALQGRSPENQQQTPTDKLPPFYVRRQDPTRRGTEMRAIPALKWEFFTQKSSPSRS